MRNILGVYSYIYEAVLCAVQDRSSAQYSFTGADDAKNELMVTGGAFLAFIGAFPLVPKRTRLNRDFQRFSD